MIRELTGILVAAVLIAATAPFALADKPNILFIFSDDHAQHAISAYGSKVNKTPHIDRLAAEGARFTNSFVTNSICTPSRATLLTGQYSHLNGVPVFNRFDGSRDTVAKHMQAGGYHTGMIGKWHLGSDPTGFDRWIVLPGQARTGIRPSSSPATSSPSRGTPRTSPATSASSCSRRGRRTSRSS